MNKELAKIFEAISYYLEMESVAFKPQAYRRVAEILDSLQEDISKIYLEGGIEKLQEIPGIGKSIVLQIEEFIKTGKVLMLEEYFKKIPIKLFDLLSLNGLGPKTIYSLYINLGVKDIPSLKKALEEGKIRTVPRLGMKMEIKLAKALNFYDKEEEVPNEEDLKMVDQEIGDLIRLSDIKGDLHIHTPRDEYGKLADDEEEQIWSYINLGLELGYKYIGISNHTEYLKIERGLSGEELMLEKELINKINSDLKKKGIDFKVYHGCECNILKDGLLDIGDKYLKELDYVMGGIHSSFNLDKEEQTQRLIKALENPYLKIITHPTGRLVNMRDSYDIDLERILEVVVKNNKILEINASPVRLDLNFKNISKAVNLRIKLVINTDSHSIEQMRVMKYGIAEARKGKAGKEDILNSKEILDF
jgi:histidinol phosphatase-like PHP family hydrolase